VLSEQTVELLAEYAVTDPHAEVIVEKDGGEYSALKPDLQKALIATVYSCPNGIFRMSPDIKDLVQTSNNLARVLVKDGVMQIGCLTRSSVDTERDDLANAISASFSMLGEEVALGGKYPGWTPLPTSSIVELMSDLYRELFNEEPHVAACHAGLECGILGRNYPDIEMISFGPNIYGAHSPDERVQISSVQKFWRFLLEALKRIPKA
jgi:dipeptidase D